MIRVAIQGQAGSFHDTAARQWYGDTCQIVDCVSFTDVFDALSEGTADAAIVAVENTIYGSINEVYQLIEQCPLPITGEIKLSVDQQLIGLPGVSLDTIRSVYSHPVALAQCRKFITNTLPQAERIEFFDTAGAVEYIASEQDPSMAAIASASAAELYNLEILQPDIQDSSHNLTRFLVLDNNYTVVNANRSSIIVTTDHKPGALLEVLQFFSNSEVNIVKLQSQPIIGSPWQYKFFIVSDVAGDSLNAILNKLEQTNHTVKLLGEYAAG